MATGRRARRTLLTGGLLLTALTVPAAQGQNDAQNVYAEQIAFSRSQNGRTSIYVMEPDGSALSQVTSPEFDDLEPCWSPDGMGIAYQSKRPSWRIFTAEANGSNERQITTTLSWSPSWSPDGDSIAYAAPCGRGTELFVASLVTGVATQLTSDGATNGRPSWSPDGSQIVFHSNIEGPTSLFVIDGDGENMRRITQSSARDFQARWSPDGKRLVFSSERDGNREIYTIQVDGTHLRRLTDNPADDVLPAWSPDGEWIAFVSSREGADSIYKMKADGSHVTRLTDGDGDDMYPTWKPRLGLPAGTSENS